MRNTLHALLDEAARTAANRTAIISPARNLTYRELASETHAAAAWLRSHHVRRGDRVVIRAPNSPEVVGACYAASRLGAVFVVINSDTKPFQLRDILDNAAPVVVLTDDPARLPADCTIPVLPLAEYPAKPAGPAAAATGDWPGISTDPACLIYTSGSTAAPKGVVSPHRAMRFAVDAIAGQLGLRPDDVIGIFLPISFDYGLYQIFLAAQARATLALGDPALVGPALPALLARWQVSVLPLVPSIAHALLRMGRRKDSARLPALRAVTNTGARLAPEVIDELRDAQPGLLVYAMFGLTECKRVSILDPADLDRKRGSVGRPLPDTECLIVDDDGHPVPPGATGELVVRGPHVMAGYWQAPEQTARRFRRFGAGTETALYTGDLCAADADGYLYFRGRHDDIYKSNGQRVSTLEVEAAALDVPGVAEAAVLPPLDDANGARLFVAGRVDPMAVLTGLRERLAAAKVPDQVQVLDSLPLSINRKVDRNQLRQLVRSS